MLPFVPFLSVVLLRWPDHAMYPVHHADTLTTQVKGASTTTAAVAPAASRLARRHRLRLQPRTTWRRRPGARSGARACPRRQSPSGRSSPLRMAARKSESESVSERVRVKRPGPVLPVIPPRRDMDVCAEHGGWRRHRRWWRRVPQVSARGGHCTALHCPAQSWIRNAAMLDERGLDGRCDSHVGGAPASLNYRRTHA